MNPLNQPEKDLCTWSGAAGCAITLVCTIQLFVLMKAHWASFSMLAILILCMITFLLLALHKSIAAPMLIACSVGVLFVVAVWLVSPVFSLIGFLHMVYTIIITVLVYVQDIAGKLKLKDRLQREEENEWATKLN